MKRFIAIALLVAASGCGAKTGLAPGAPVRIATDGGGSDSGGRDAALPDAGLDAMPDAKPDASHVGCTDASSAYIFVLSAGQKLYRFAPDSGRFEFVGNVNCNTGQYVNSMAVDRAGHAYVSYDGAEMFRVDTTTAACSPTAFDAAALGWSQYGMGFSAVGHGPAEQLFIAEATYQHPSVGFGTVDTRTYAFHFVSAFDPPLGNAVELSGTADGRLYAFFLDPVAGSHLALVDKTNGRILQQTPLDVGGPDSAFAFAYWGGDFIFFTGPFGGPATVTRYHPADGSLVKIASLTEAIVGAGVSTCAPE